jgi:hypothetical protein
MFGFHILDSKRSSLALVNSRISKLGSLFVSHSDNLHRAAFHLVLNYSSIDISFAKSGTYGEAGDSTTEQKESHQNFVTYETSETDKESTPSSPDSETAKREHPSNFGELGGVKAVN